MADEQQCSGCGLPIHRDDVLRHAGRFVSHEPWRCIQLLQSRLEESALLELQAREAIGRLSLELGHPALEVGDNETWPGKLIDAAILRLTNYKEGWEKCDEAWGKEVAELEAENKAQGCSLDSSTKLLDAFRALPLYATERNWGTDEPDDTIEICIGCGMPEKGNHDGDETCPVARVEKLLGAVQPPAELAGPAEAAQPSGGDEDRPAAPISAESRLDGLRKIALDWYHTEDCDGYILDDHEGDLPECNCGVGDVLRAAIPDCEVYVEGDGNRVGLSRIVEKRES